MQIVLSEARSGRPALPFAVPLTVISSKLSVAALCLLVAGCGGGGSSESPPPTTSAPAPGPAPAPVPSPSPPPVAANPDFKLASSTYGAGDLIAIPDSLGDASEVALWFERTSQTIVLPLISKGYVLAPVLSRDLQSDSIRLVLKTAAGSVRSEPFVVQPLAITTDTPGLATLIYLDASIDAIKSNVYALVAAAGDEAGEDVRALQAFLRTTESTRVLVQDAMKGLPTTLGVNGNGQPVIFDPSQLRELDQVFGVLQKLATAPIDVLQRKAASPGRMQALAFNCSTLQSANDRAWCQNQTASIANDYLINVTGMAATVVGTAGALAGVAAVVAGVATTLPLSLAAAAAAMVVGANVIGGAIQAASAYGTNSREGLNTVENVQNIGNVAVDVATSFVLAFGPTQRAPLVDEMFSALANLTNSKVLDKIDKPRVNPLVQRINATVQSAGSAADQASRLTGIWDGSLTSWQVTLGNCGDLQITGPFSGRQFTQTSKDSFDWFDFWDPSGASALTFRRDASNPLLFYAQVRSAAGVVDYYAQFSKGYASMRQSAFVVSTSVVCNFQYEAQFSKR